MKASFTGSYSTLRVPQRPSFSYYLQSPRSLTHMTPESISQPPPAWLSHVYYSASGTSSGSPRGLFSYLPASCGFSCAVIFIGYQGHSFENEVLIAFIFIYTFYLLFSNLCAQQESRTHEPKTKSHTLLTEPARSPYL